MGKKIALGCIGFLLVVFLVLLTAFSHLPTTHAASVGHLDAVTVHGYWLSQKGNGPVTLSLRSQLAVRAAYILYKNHIVDYVVFTSGPIWGQNYPALGKVMEDQLLAYGVPAKHIISRNTAMDTYDEVGTFLAVAKKYHWAHLGDIAATVHDITIPTLYDSFHAHATYLTYEDILQTYGSQEDKKTLNNIPLTIDNIGLGLYETLVRVTLFFDPRYQLLGAYAKTTRNRKNFYGGIPFLPTDQYGI